MNRWKALWVFSVLSLALCSCGSSDTALMVVFDTSAYVVPDELSSAHVQVRDNFGVLSEQSFELAGVDAPSIVLGRGKRTPADVVLRTLGLLNESLVVTAPDQAATFLDGEVVEVVVVFPRL